MSDDLILKIGADAKDAVDAIGNLGDKIGGTNDNLIHFAEAAAISFAAFTAQVALSVLAFEEADQTSKALSQSLQNQGIYSDELKESYEGYAEQVQALTGFEAVQVEGAQAVLQGYLGEIPVTQELTNAVADLAQAKGITLKDAATELGRAIQNGSGALLREGLAFSDTSTTAERYGETLEFVNGKWGGLAAQANTGVGSIRGLQAAIKDSEAELGEKFAPAVTFVIKALTDFLTPSEEAGDELTNLKASFITAGLVVTGLGVAIPVLAQAFLIAKAAAKAFNLELTGTKIALAGIGIGLLVIALTELYLHWDDVTARIKVIVQGLVTFVSGSFKGLGEVINGAFHLDADKIKAGLDDVQNAFKTSVATATQTLPVETAKALGQQDAIKKKYADEDRESTQINDAISLQLRKANEQLVLLQLRDANSKEIDLKKQEITNLKAQQKTNDDDEYQTLKAQHAKILQEEQLYAGAYEVISTALNQKSVQGAASAASDLVALTGSKNDELKAIGKAASVTQITIKTAESAMNIYAGFSAIPIVGPALGIAGAAAAVAYGAEQIGDVLSAQTGGVVPGVGFGDRIPSLLEPGELITPKNNFDEVVNSVAQTRTNTSPSGSQQQDATIQLILKDKLMDFIEAKLVQRRHLNISIVGRA